jgi:hypothetical protein
MDTNQHLIAARELLQTAEDILPKQRRTSATHGYKTAAITWHRTHKNPEPQAGKSPLLWALFSSKKFLTWKSYYNQLWMRYPLNGTHNLQRQYTSNVWRQRLCPDCSYTITEQIYDLEDNPCHQMFHCCQKWFFDFGNVFQVWFILTSFWFADSVQLSEDSLVYIFGFLDACSLATASAVCKYFTTAHSLVVLSFSSLYFRYFHKQFEILGQNCL